MAAPSAGNQQPWCFVVIDDRQTLDAIPTFHEYAQMLKQAPLAIAVCAEVRREAYRGYWVQDCSAATQNLLLAAHAVGLGAVWLGVHPVESRVRNTRELLGLPEQVIPLAIVAIGHPAEQPRRVDRYEADRVHHNRW